MTTNYIARLDGEIVGKRSTKNRTYSHAIVAQDVEDAQRAWAYDYKADKTDRSNFDYYSSIVRDGAKHRHFTYDTPEQIATQIADAQAKVEGGFDAYAARLREAAIASFEEKKANGGFAPYVIGWAGRRDLADKAARQQIGAGGWGPHTRKLVAIVEAEVA